MKIITLLLVTLLFIGCNKKEKEEKQIKNEQNITKKSKRESTIDSFILKDSNKTIKNIAIDQERVLFHSDKPITLFFFFASWCPSCKAQLPELKRVLKEFSKDIEIIGILLDQPKEGFLQNLDFFVSTSYKTNVKLADKIYALVHAPATMPIPMIVMFNKGKYFIHYLGAVPYEMIASDIKRAKGE